jgi:hypothetical protein
MPGFPLTSSICIDRPAKLSVFQYKVFTVSVMRICEI